MKVNRALVILALTVSIAVVFSACDNPTGLDGDSNGTNQDNADYTSPTIGTLVYVPAGKFRREASPTNVSIISRPFRMSEHVITRRQFFSIMGTDPSDPSKSTFIDDPVQGVSWYDAIAFANKLSISEGLPPVYSVAGITDWEALDPADIPTPTTGDKASWNAATADWDANGYRLPTEMEWMWAAMGADQDSNGDAMQNGVNRSGYTKLFAGYDGSNSIDDYAWYGGTTTHPVGTKAANELGLYDMSGNVWEWTWDWFGGYPSGERTDYRGAASGSFRVKRGGSGFNLATFCAVAYRSNLLPQSTSELGFRLVRL